MAKQRKVLPARKQGDRSRDDDSLLLRSAESLGRVIGVLQRQLDQATKRLSYSTADSGPARAGAQVRRRQSTVVKRIPTTAAKRKTTTTTTKRKTTARSSTKVSERQAKKR